MAMHPAPQPAAAGAPPLSAGPASDLIRSARFRAEREADWRDLERLLTKAERRGLRALDFAEAQALASHYRQAMAALSLAREISLDRALLAYLEALCARAYLSVYAPQAQLGGLLHRLFVTGIPGAVRRLLPEVLLAVAILGLGFAAGWLAYWHDQTLYNTLIPSGLAQGRDTGASAATLRQSIYSGGNAQAWDLGAFASVLFSNNTQVAILVFALGAMAGIATVALTFYNGVVLGLFVALHHDRGLLVDIGAWLTIHGTTELFAIALAAAGGLHLARAVLFPGQIRRRDALRRNAHDAVKLALLAGVMLLVAAVVEGFGRQWVQSIEVRFAIGGTLLAGWLLYFTRTGRGDAGFASRDDGPPR